MKKRISLIVSLLLIAVMCLSLTGCGANGTYKFEEMQFTGEAWDKLPQTMKDIVTETNKKIYEKFSIKIEGENMSIFMGESEVGVVPIKISGKAITAINESETLKEYGDITISGGKITLELKAGATGYSIKIVLKKQ